MDASDLARWTRFAAKGGIGKCTAMADCIAENEGDLMFLKGDEITVLMQLNDQEGKYLGYCEGVVGRFSGTDVRFHGKLKKPIMTKRSSTSASQSSAAKSPSPAGPSAPPSDTGSPVPKQPSSSQPDQGGISVDGSIDQVLSLNHRIRERISVPPQVTAPLNVLSKKAPQSPASSSFPPTPSSQVSEVLSSPPQPPSPTIPTDPAAAADAEKRQELSYGTYEDPSTRFSVASSDAEAGIGLTMLQALANDDDDDDNWSEGSRYSTRFSSQGPLAESTVTEPNGLSNLSKVAHPSEMSEMSHVPPSSPPVSPTRSTHTYESDHPRRPSLAPSAASSGSWEGAIYDDYRYSRQSVTSKISRFSSMSNIAGSSLRNSQQQVPPPPIPDSRSTPLDLARPSLDGSESSIPGPVRRPPRTVSLATKLPTRPPIPLSLQPRAPPGPITPAPEPSPLLHTNWGSPTSSTYESLHTVPSWGSPRENAADTASSAAQSFDTAKEARDDTADTVGLGFGGQIVVDDDEELPSNILSSIVYDSPPSSPEPSFKNDGEDNNPGEGSASEVSSAEPDKEAATRGGRRGSDSLLSSPPGPPVQPSSPLIPPPPPSPSTAAPAPSEQHLRPSLADLRGQRIPGTNVRQSLFLPHPNAPKAPASSESGGPMYIQTPRERQERMSRLSMAFINKNNLANLIGQAGSGNTGGPDVRGGGVPPGLPPPVRMDSVGIIRVALSKLSQPGPPHVPSNTGRNGPQRVTIYGRTQVDLAMSTGPVPIIFSVDPFPATAPPPNAVQHRQPPRGDASAGADGNMLSHQSASLGTRRPSTAPDQARFGPVLETEAKEREPPVPQKAVEWLVERSATLESSMVSARASGPGLLVPAALMPAVGRSATISATSSGGNLGESRNGTHNGTSGTNLIPRSKFFPKVPGMRPRSRSFSAFDSGGTSDASTRRPDGLAAPADPEPLASTEGSSDPPTSLSNSGVTSLSSTSQSSLTPTTKAIVNAPPLRPSPLSLAQSSSASRNGDLEKLESPVISSNYNTPSPSLSSGPGTQLPPIGTSPSLLPLALRPAVGAGSPGPFPSVPLSPVDPPSEKLKTRPSDDTDAASVNSDSRSFLAPSITIRQNSLRSKLSLPNLRRHRSKHDETSSLASSTQHLEIDTVQVKDTDFELVRPSIPFLSNRNSEDFRKDGMLDPYPNSGSPSSPAVSNYSGRSPTVASDTPPWPSPKHEPIAIKPTSETEQLDAHRQRELRWVALMSSVPPSQSRKTKKIKKLLLEGVPASVRYLVWTHVTNGRGRIVAGVYPQLCSRGRVAASDVIATDTQRCFREHPQLQGPESPVLTVLQAYLNMVPDVRYAKGLTLIVGQLLLQGPEEEVFWIFVSLMDSYLRPYFSINSIQLEVDATLFSRMLGNNDAQVAKRMLMDMSIAPEVICSSWFRSVFVDALPSTHVNRVWDIFMYEGIPFLVRVGLALIACCRRQVLECKDEKALLELIHHPPLKLLPPNPDTLITLALNQKVKDDDIRKQRIKMEAQVKRQTQAQAPRKSTSHSAISLPRTESFN